MPLDLSLPNLRPDAPALRLGCVPLVDAAPLLVAEALGFFQAVGLRAALAPETSWAGLRDRLAFGALDGAHLLTPLALALGAGAGGIRADLAVGCGLSRNGNGIFLSWRALETGLRPGARLGIVHPFSAHHYLLRRWLAAQGVEDAVPLAAPPPAMADLVAQGVIDGFCAGAPWPAAAEASRLGRVVAGTAALWPDHPEKLLAFRGDVAEARREAALAATAAILAAGAWLNAPENREEAVAILRRRAFPALPDAVIASAFDGTHRMGFVPEATAEGASRWIAEMREAGHLPPDIADAALLAPWARSLQPEAARRLAPASHHGVTS
ncbi:CmpA/NrtA family ABC transporter substrate-binding protein [Sabulicella rubraurantiaca]|uniref:CmpA/NrtA family ABC transporter substrate-binding protein n=1 Tax=Sabulicella rubraurantiaca TaxID=2811429 RepID=UPI001A95E48C|nr:CmpA/NrtA family ABC transporter substrate-binding protein [Sabulicella rubraurantiaca]